MRTIPKADFGPLVEALEENYDALENYYLNLVISKWSGYTIIIFGSFLPLNQ